MRDAMHLSIVIPVHNEAAAIESLVDELMHVLTQDTSDFEIICVDDGSTDGSGEWLEMRSRADQHVKVLRCRERRGQSTALWIGFQAAQGEMIAMLDGDGQNDPRDIPRMLAELSEWYMVVGHRVNRRDAWRKRVFSRCANGLRNWLTGSKVPDSGCGLKVFRKACVASFIPFRGMHRYLPTFVEMAGGRVISMKVGHRARRSGRSHYGIVDRLLSPFLDCLALAWLRRRRIVGRHFESQVGVGAVAAISQLQRPTDRVDRSRTIRVDAAENAIAPDAGRIPHTRDNDEAPVASANAAHTKIAAPVASANSGSTKSGIA